MLVAEACPESGFSKVRHRTDFLQAGEHCIDSCLRLTSQDIEIVMRRPVFFDPSPSALPSPSVGSFRHVCDSDSLFLLARSWCEASVNCNVDSGDSVGPVSFSPIGPRGPRFSGGKGVMHRSLITSTCASSWPVHGVSINPNNPVGPTMDLRLKHACIASGLQRIPIERGQDHDLPKCQPE